MTKRVLAGQIKHETNTFSVLPTTLASYRARLLLEGGEVTDSIQTGRKAIACALGGNDGRTLFVSSSESTDRDICLDRRSASIRAFEVAIASMH